MTQNFETRNTVGYFFIIIREGVGYFFSIIREGEKKEETKRKRRGNGKGNGKGNGEGRGKGNPLYIRWKSALRKRGSQEKWKNL